MADLPLPCLCLVTDRRQCDGRALEDVVAHAVKGGVNLVQLRERDLPAKQLLSLAYLLRDITSGRALLFVNDRIDVALACGADGVQLGEEGLPVDAARRASEGRLLLGRSVHSVEGAEAAEAEGADLLVVGTTFHTDSHSQAPAAGVGLLEQVRSRANIPFLAIGGVNDGNVGSAIEAGASGAAVITAITRSRDPADAARNLVKRMREVWASTAERRVARQG